MSLFVSVLAILCVLTTIHAEDEYFNDDGYDYYEEPDNKPQERIMGGNITRIADFPSTVKITVRISKTNTRHCGGVIVNENWALTAGHCVAHDHANDITVRAGSTNMNQGGTLHRARKVVVHDKYEKKGKTVPTYDIALIKVDKPFNLRSPNVKAAVLAGARQTVPVGSRAIKVGWGYYELSKTELSPDLRMVDSFVISNDECKMSGLKVDEYNFCTTDICGDHKSTMQGEAGGPIFVGETVYGVHTSAFRDKSTKIRPDKHNHIPHFRVWIARVAGV